MHVISRPPYLRHFIEVVVQSMPPTYELGAFANGMDFSIESSRNNKKNPWKTKLEEREDSRFFFLFR